MESTLKDQGRSTGVEHVRLLTWVLRYDDLLAKAWEQGRPRPEASQTFALEAPRVVLKRGEGTAAPAWRHSAVELHVSDPHASRDHVTLERRGAATVAIDGGSSNGTFINGARLTVDTPLADGDLLQTGHSLWCYREVPKTLLRALERGATLGPSRSHCAEVAELYRQLALLAPSREPVLVIAETGSGKELVANAVHRLSGRSGGFVAVDCGAVPESLFESTFFGHVRGAYTGAADAREGEVARAHQGTLFLDEVGNLAAPSQAKLLRVLESSQVSALGARGPTPVDVRWIAATNAQVFDAQGFRSDLVHRLAGFVARLPPLRQRREDLGTLTAQFLEEMSVARASITPEAAQVLFNHPFPGNVRQLRAAVRSAVLLARGDSRSASGLVLDLRHFPELQRKGTEPQSGEAAEAGKPARGRPPTPEELSAALESTGGNVSQAAKLLHTYPRQVYRWLEQMPVVLEKFRK